MPHKHLKVVPHHSAGFRGVVSTAPPASDRVSLETLFLDNLGVIESAVRFVCRRHKVAAAEAEEFESEVKLKMVERDYEVLRRFEGRSTLRTYLTVVIGRMYLDYRNQQWGKWRPSAEARRLGTTAIRLETLMVRDGLGFAEASRHLVHREGVTASEEQLMQIACRLPVRLRRTMVGEAALETVSSDVSADEAAVLAERRAMAIRMAGTLRGAIAGLPEHDRLILRLRFLEELSVADIGRLLRIDSKPLYRRVDVLLKHLRDALVHAGVSEAEVHEVFNGAALDINLALLGSSPDAGGTAAAEGGRAS